MSTERPAPLVLVPAPAEGRAPFGSYRAVAETGRDLLAAELTGRLGRAGAAVVALAPAPGSEPGETRQDQGVRDEASGGFHWGRWFAPAARTALREARRAGRAVDAIGYAGSGALALASDAAIDELLSPIPGEIVANNRFSADAFVVAGIEPRPAPDGTPRIGPSLERAIERLESCPTDNTAARCVESAGFTSRDLAAVPGSRFDVDTPQDLALLRLATRLPDRRRPDQRVTSFLEMARLPGDRELALPKLDALGEVLRDRSGQLVVAGRVPSELLRFLETETACRVRAFVEERGMRAARDLRPRSLLARWVEERGAAGLVAELASLGDAVVLDTRVLMAALAGTADAAGWPPTEERFASDFEDAAAIGTAWLRELVEAASAASVPFLLGGHGLVGDGLRVVVDAAWAGR